MSEPVSEPHSSEDLVELRAEPVDLSRSVELLAERVSALERGRELPEVASTTYSLVTPAASQAAGSSSSGIGAGYTQSVVHPKANIVIKDFSGVVTTHPVRILSRFSEVRAISFQGHWGDSIFVGLPSQREVSVCLRAGGFSGPSHYP